jgi:hypothetical protein
MRTRIHACTCGSAFHGGVEVVRIKLVFSKVKHDVDIAIRNEGAREIAADLVRKSRRSGEWEEALLVMEASIEGP